MTTDVLNSGGQVSTQLRVAILCNAAAVLIVVAGLFVYAAGNGPVVVVVGVVAAIIAAAFTGLTLSVQNQTR